MFDLPKTILGSNNMIEIFKNFADKQNGRDIYPPVLITNFILFFFKYKYPFIIEINIRVSEKGNLKIFFDI